MTQKELNKKRQFEGTIKTMRATVENLRSMNIDNGECVSLAERNLSRFEALYKIWSANHE